jgi:hypothetical protein
MHDMTSLYDALGRRPYLTPGERDVFLRKLPWGTIGYLLSAVAGRYDDADVICLTRRAVNNPHPAMQFERVML